MDETNEFIHENPTEGIPMDGEHQELDSVLKPNSLESLLERDTIPDIPSPDISEMNFDDELLNSENILRSSVI